MQSLFKEDEFVAVADVGRFQEAAIVGPGAEDGDAHLSEGIGAVAPAEGPADPSRRISVENAINRPGASSESASIMWPFAFEAVSGAGLT